MARPRGDGAAFLCESCRRVAALVRVDGGGGAAEAPVALCGGCYTRLLRALDALDATEPTPKIESRVRSRRRDTTPS